MVHPHIIRLKAKAPSKIWFILLKYYTLPILTMRIIILHVFSRAWRANQIHWPLFQKDSYEIYAENDIGGQFNMQSVLHKHG